jgi:hypothetical protein
MQSPTMAAVHRIGGCGIHQRFCTKETGRLKPVFHMRLWFRCPIFDCGPVRVRLLHSAQRSIPLSNFSRQIIQ